LAYIGETCVNNILITKHETQAIPREDTQKKKVTT